MAASDPSKKLGEKLLQGWCMLDKTCDTCYVPIMRDRNNREYCVGCESYMDQPRPRQAQEEVKQNSQHIEPQVRSSQHAISSNSASDLQNVNSDLSSALSHTKSSILASMSFQARKLQESSDLQYR
jgi:uncharacterized Zn finger protein (UPF0148 family)